MDIQTTGLITLGVLFILQGILHLIRTRVYENYAIERGFVSAKQSVMLSGFLLIVAGAGLMLPTIRTYAVYALLLFLVVSALAFHRFWECKDGETQVMESMNFMKNLMIGVLLAMLEFGGSF